MKKIAQTLTFFFYLSLITIPELALSQKYEPNTIIAKLRVKNSDFFENKAKLHNLDIQFIKSEAIFKNETRKKSDLNRIYKLTISKNNSVSDYCKKLESTKLFEYCQPNYYDSVLYSPNDTRIAQQYSIAKTRAKEAWDIDKGDSTIVVGVIDTGIDLDHEDLKTKIAYNFNDPIDGVDNDYDGYIDNFRGWDFGSGDNNPHWNESADTTNLVHGIFVCGLAGAKTDNGLGIASLGFSNKILPIKILNDNGALINGYEAIIYAAEHGCQIINCSWGSTTPHKYGRDVIKYVTEDLGLIVVGAAGNQNNEKLYYPASYQNVMSVAATNINDHKWSGSPISSSYNWRVDISAPGESVYSTLENNSYKFSSGTSFSAPMVASALALLMSYYPDTLSNLQFIEILKTKSDLIDTIPANQAYKNKLGAGRLNLFRALEGNFGPSLVSKDHRFLKNGQSAQPGDTADISGVIKNYLALAQNVNISIESLSDHIDMIDSNITISSISENQSIPIQDILVYIHDDAPFNEQILLRLNYEADNYSKTETVLLEIISPSIELKLNKLKTTLFPSGRIAYNNKNEGSGFELDYQGSMLYEMGFIAGSSETNSIANINYHNSFITLSLLDSSRVDKRWKANCKVQGSDINPLDIDIEYELFNDSIYSNIIFAHYKIFNNSSENLNEFYFGMFADWDIMHRFKNYTTVNDSLKMAICQSYIKKELGAIQLLSNNNWNRYAINNLISSNPVNSTDGLSRSELYYILSNQNKYEGIENNGTDILDVISSGPFTFDINDTLELSFAIIADSSLQNVVIHGQNAKQLFDSLYPTSIGIKEIYNNTKTLTISPNPSRDYINIDCTDCENLQIINIYDMNGKLVLQTKLVDGSVKIDVSEFIKGTYIVQINNESFKVSIE